MATTAWELSQFMGIHTQPGKVANGHLYAEDMENLRIDGDGWLQLRSDRLGLGPLGYEITGVATTPKHAFILRNTTIPAGVSVQYGTLLEITRIYEDDAGDLGHGVDVTEISAHDAFDGNAEECIFIGYGTDPSERDSILNIPIGADIVIRQDDLFLHVRIIDEQESLAGAQVYGAEFVAGDLDSDHVSLFTDGATVDVKIVGGWHDEKLGTDNAIRFGAGDPVVWEEGQELDENSRLYVRARDDLSTETKIQGISDLEGRISLVNFNTYVILTSEGADQGYIIDMREGDEQYTAYPLGFDAPESDALSATVVEEVPNGTDRNLYNRFSSQQLSGDTFYHYLFTTVSLNDTEDPWYGMESNPAQITLVEELIEGYDDISEVRGFVFAPDRNQNAGRVVVSYQKPAPVSHVRIYRSSPIENERLESVELTDFEREEVIRESVAGLQYRLVGEVDVSDEEDSSGGFTFYDGMSDEDWADNELLIFTNDRMPSGVKQIHEYNDLIFAPVGDRLIYSDLRNGVIVPWAFPEANEIRVQGRVDFCGEINEVLLFGGRGGLWRLAGNTEYNFAVGQISNSGPIDGYAWSKITDALAFVGEGGLFVTDASSVVRVSEIVLDDFFQDKKVVRGAVAFFKDGDVLYSVTLEDREGNTEDYQFKREDAYWVRWNLDFMQSASIVEDNKATLVLIADGTGQLKRLDWNSTANAEADVAWSWTSQLLDEPGPGYANRRKRYSQFQFTGEADNAMKLQVWKDNEVDPAVEKIFSSRENLIPVRVPINRVARRLRFRVSGTGPVKVQGMRVEMMV